MESMIINSREVLGDGGQVYARISFAGHEKIIPASIIELDGSVGGVEKISTRFEVEGLSDAQAREIRSIRDITIYVLNKGVLYAIPSKLEKFAADSTVRFTAVMPSKCRGAVMRQTERYSVFGTYRLYRRGVSDVGCKLFAVPMNVSMGGFGIKMETPDIRRGDEVHFEISLYTIDEEKANTESPSVDINGTAQVCNLLELRSENLSYIGFGFVNVPAGCAGALAFWLKSHQGILTRI